MKLPERVATHITETSSFKVFSNNIPDSWIIREVTERDYGIDCYIELVNTKNQVTGELISIQLKGKQVISWTRENYFTFSGINISTTNYWNRFPTPVFICLVDVVSKEVFFCPVKSRIRQKYYDYAKQEKFSYRIEKRDKLELSNLKPFISSYFQEKQIRDLELNLTTFISHYQQYQDFVNANVGRDCFMGVEEEDRILYLKHFYNNLRFLCNFFDLGWDIEPLKEYFKRSQEYFGNDYPIYEQQMDEVVEKLDSKMKPILLKLKDHIVDKEKDYWMITDINLFNLMSNVNDNGELYSW
ncbi:DUF4365 domain-containing protein [Mesoflavibacter zeaxanthinifaciens]|uniref:DUF4365 domain-containing protein n=1 Tax=Mesoflavibacter zeaxanthinifaciens TaxID=393060 RepID=UPI003A8F0535